MKQNTIKLLGFGCLLVIAMLASNALFHSAEQTIAPLPTVGATQKVVQPTSDLLLPQVSVALPAAKGGGANRLTTPMVHNTATGSVFTARTNKQMYSYGATAANAAPYNRIAAKKASSQPISQNTPIAMPGLPAASKPTLGYAAAADYIRPAMRKAGPPTGEGGRIDNWLNSEDKTPENGWGYTSDGINYWNYSYFFDLLNGGGDTNLPPGLTWEQFYEWLSGGSTQHAFPLSDATPFLLLLALAYIATKKHKTKTQAT